MNDITKRFLEAYELIKDRENINSASAFATEIDISTSLFTEICKKRTNAGIKPIQHIIKRFPYINANWLIGDIGNKTIKDDNTIKYLKVLEDNIELRKEIDYLKSLLNNIETTKKGSKRSVS